MGVEHPDRLDVLAVERRGGARKLSLTAAETTLEKVRGLALSAFEFFSMDVSTNQFVLMLVIF